MRGEKCPSSREGPTRFGNMFISLDTKDWGLLKEGAGRGKEAYFPGSSAR